MVSYDIKSTTVFLAYQVCRQYLKACYVRIFGTPSNSEYDMPKLLGKPQYLTAHRARNIVTLCTTVTAIGILTLLN